MIILHALLHACRLSNCGPAYPLPPEDMHFEVRVEIDHHRVLRNIQRVLGDYRDKRHGPTAILMQTNIGRSCD